MPTPPISVAMNTNRNVSILGCGWLGTELAKTLLSEGYQVKGSTTSEDKISQLEELGIDTYLIDLSQVIHSFDTAFFQSDTLIINIPPGRRDPEVHINYPSRIKKALAVAKANSIKHVLLVSSTGVYRSRRAHAPDWNFPSYTDENPNAEGKSPQALATAEGYLDNAFGNNGTILRFGGLVGGDRLAGRFLAGKKNLKNGAAPVNMIHRDDCVDIIRAILEQNAWGKKYNATAEVHPSRKAFYTAQANKHGFECPKFLNETEAEGKIVSNAIFKDELRYTFLHPNPMNF